MTGNETPYQEAISRFYPIFQESGIGRRYWDDSVVSLKRNGEDLKAWAGAGGAIRTDIGCGMGMSVGGEEQVKTINLIARAICLTDTHTVRVTYLDSFLNWMVTETGGGYVESSRPGYDSLCFPVFYDDSYKTNPLGERDRVRIEGYLHYLLDGQVALFLGTPVSLAEIPSTWWSSILIGRMEEVIQHLS